MLANLVIWFRVLSVKQDFAVTRFLVKLFKSVNLDLINECRFWFNFSLSSELLEKRIAKFQKRYEGIGHIIR